MHSYSRGIFASHYILREHYSYIQVLKYSNPTFLASQQKSWSICLSFSISSWTNITKLKFYYLLEIYQSQSCKCMKQKCLHVSVKISIIIQKPLGASTNWELMVFVKFSLPVEYVQNKIPTSENWHRKGLELLYAENRVKTSIFYFLQILYVAVSRQVNLIVFKQK